MPRFLIPVSTALLALVMALPAWAGGIAVIDFQRAVQETSEGQQASARIEQAYASRQSEIRRQQQELQTALEDYEQRKLILNDEARRAAEEDLMARQRKLQEDAVRFEQEMQKQYMEAVSDLDQKMRDMSARIAKERGYDLVLDKQVVVFAGTDVVDMTDELIKRYDAK
jgi:outer membrane protein